MIDLNKIFAPFFGLAVSLGLVRKYNTVNKFGEALDCDSGVSTDVWDGANSSGASAVGTKIWVPPTTARVHQIASSSINDRPTGTGALTVEVFYLPDWDTIETSTIITLNGTTNVAMPSCVMINRMECLTWGAGGVNAGNITATADVDGTVTSAILAGNNQTQQCIYGVPSVQKLRMAYIHASIVKGTGTSQRADGVLYAMRDPNTNVSNNKAWTNKESFQLVEGNSPWNHPYGDTPKKIDGPCIVKINVTSNSNNTKCTAGFNSFIKKD